MVLLAACGGRDTANPTNEGDAVENPLTNLASATEQPALTPGLYEVTLVETVAGAGQSQEEHQQQCVSAELAQHPEYLLANATMQGCTAVPAMRDGNQIRGELRCEENHNILIAASFGTESWERTLSGAGPEGSYESHENAHRVGDC